MVLPPSGFVAGVYARGDGERGVLKPPTGDAVRGVVGLESVVDHAAQGVLNQEGVNVLRSFDGEGIRLWGARTLSSDPEWKYINIRRYLLFLEHSIDQSTQWAVFEPNGEAPVGHRPAERGGLPRHPVAVGRAGRPDGRRTPTSSGATAPP